MLPTDGMGLKGRNARAAATSRYRSQRPLHTAKEAAAKSMGLRKIGDKKEECLALPGRSRQKQAFQAFGRSEEDA